MRNTTKNKIISTVMLLAVAMIWGFAFVAQTAATESLGANSFTGIRFILGGMTVLPAVLLFEKENKDKPKLKRTLVCAVLSGIAMYLACITQQYGIEITQSAGKAGFMTAFYTVLVPIVSCIVYKHKLGINVWIGAVLAIVGLYFLSTSGNPGESTDEAINIFASIGMGEIWLIVSSLFWTLQLMLVDFSGKKDVSPLKFSMIQFFTCGFIGTVLGLIFEPESFTLASIKGGLIPVLYAGILSVGLAFTLQTVAQKRSDPTTAAIIFSTESLFGTIGGALILHERMAGRAYIGCAIMFVGLLLSQIDIKALIKRRLEK